VIVLADRDAPGLKHARHVHQQLQAVAASVTLAQPSVGKDITDHLAAGIPLDDIEILGPEIPEPATERVPRAPEAVFDPTGEEPISPASGGPVDERKARIRITKASSFKIAAVQWVWEGRMPLGELCLIAGREGVGKSTFLAWLASAVTNGNLPGVYHGQPRAVLYSATEDAWSYTIAPRMKAAGADLDMVYRIDVIEDDGPAGLNLPRDSRYLPEIAEETKAAMLMCDPILSLVDGRINPNQGRELRTALEPLKHAAEQAGLAIPALVHFNKTKDVDVLSMMAGSRAWAEVARAALAIAEDQTADEYTCVVSQGKNNLGFKNLPNLTYTIDDVVLQTTVGDNQPGPDAHIGRLRWTGETEIGAEEILQRKPVRPTDDGPGRSTSDLVMDVLDEAGRAMNPTEIMRGLEQIGAQANYNTVKQRIHHLAKTGRIERVGTGLYKSARNPTQTVPETPSNAQGLARATPSHTVTRNPPKSEGVERVTGGVDVTRVTVTAVGADLVTDGVTRACAICFGPMIVVHPGQTTHPGCGWDTRG